MMDADKPNPFQVLGLSTSATKKEIVERGRELYDTAETEEQQQIYSWAKEQLLSKPLVRLEYELFEPPGTQYENVVLDNFIRKYKKSPVTPDMLLQSTLALNEEDIHVSELINLLLQDILDVPEGDITIPLRSSQFKPISKLPLEVRDVLFG